MACRGRRKRTTTIGKHAEIKEKRRFSVPNVGYIDVSTYTLGPGLAAALYGYKSGLYEQWESEGLKVLDFYWITSVSLITSTSSPATFTSSRTLDTAMLVEPLSRFPTPKGPQTRSQTVV